MESERNKQNTARCDMAVVFVLRTLLVLQHSLSAGKTNAKELSSYICATSQREEDSPAIFIIGHGVGYFLLQQTSWLKTWLRLKVCGRG